LNIHPIVIKLPAEPYPEELWNAKVDTTWQFVFSNPSLRAGEQGIFGV
jgi:hypothetical protein